MDKSLVFTAIGGILGTVDTTFTARLGSRGLENKMEATVMEISKEEAEALAIDRADHNKECVNRVNKLIKAGNYEEGEMAVRDMLADIRHYCDANEIHFSDQDRAAYQHYLVEIQPEHG